MPTVSTDVLAAILTNFQATFNRDFKAAMGIQGWRDLVMPINSTTLTETHQWLGTVPQMVERTGGEPEFDELNAYSYTMQNRDFQAGFKVKRNFIEDDKLNLITPKLSQLGPEAARHPGQLIWDLFDSTTDGNAFDGTAFFADTRVIGQSANIDNILTGTGTTVAQIQTDLGVAVAAMSLFQDDKGRPMNLQANAIVCHPSILQLMYQALNADQGAGLVNIVLPPSANGVFNATGYKVYRNPQLSDTNDWYLLHISPGAKPFIFQSRQAPSLEGLTDPRSEAGIIRREFLYSVFARYDVGYGDPRYAIRTTNT